MSKEHFLNFKTADARKILLYTNSSYLRKYNFLCKIDDYMRFYKYKSDINSSTYKFGELLIELLHRAVSASKNHDSCNYIIYALVLRAN